MLRNPANGKSKASESSAELFTRLDAIALASDFLVSRPVIDQQSGFRLERFVFEGPHGGGNPIRIAFFAGIHGDEEAGSRAIDELARELVKNPALAEGYHLDL